jgi:hypothetical protein
VRDSTRDDDTTDPGVVQCAKCGRDADELATIAERWTWWSDGCGELVPFCPRCAEREFGNQSRSTEPG